MTESITFEKAIENVSDHIDKRNLFTVFDGSTSLAIIFNMPKEQTLDALVKYRQNIYD